MKRANEFGIAYEEDEAADPADPAMAAKKNSDGDGNDAAGKHKAATAKPKKAKEKKDD